LCIEVQIRSGSLYRSTGFNPSFLDSKLPFFENKAFSETGRGAEMLVEVVHHLVLHPLRPILFYTLFGNINQALGQDETRTCKESRKILQLLALPSG
jgi:hypothetical protein